MSATPRGDYKVDYLREDRIAQIALGWREAGGHKNSATFNIIDFVEGALSRMLKGKKQSFKIVFFDADEDDDLAYVDFRPSLTLHVDRDIWRLAKLGDPEARFIIAHEIGHLILHDHQAKAFSSDPALQIKFAEKEYSAEWQANTFAKYFLLPKHLVDAFGDHRELAAASAVPEELTRDHYRTVVQDTREMCLTCGCLSLTRAGKCVSAACTAANPSAGLTKNSTQ